MNKLDELKNSDWYKERPEVIKQVIDLLPPTKLYKFKESNKECYIIGYTEPEKGNNPNDVTLIVQKTGNGGAMANMGLGSLDTNQVFGVLLTDLIPIE